MKQKVLVKSAKQQFDEEIESMNAKYIEECCEFQYYYVENQYFATFFACFEDETHNDFRYYKSQFKTFDLMKAKHGLSLAAFLLEYDLPEMVKEIVKVEKFEDLSNDTKLRYCDFLFNNGNLCNSDVVYEDKYEDIEIPVVLANVIGEKESDVYTMSSIIEFIKAELVAKIKIAFDKSGKDVFVVPKWYRWADSKGRRITYYLGELVLQIFPDESFKTKDMEGSRTLISRTADELLYFYSLLRK